MKNKTVKLEIPTMTGNKPISSEIVGNDVIVTYEPINALRCFIGGGGNLGITYGCKRLGWIRKSGKLFILNDEEYIDSYNQWIADGCHIDSTPVKWKSQIGSEEREYRIQKTEYGIILKSGRSGFSIYNIEERESCGGCQDSNILRWEVDNKPILF